MGIQKKVDSLMGFFGCFLLNYILLRVGPYILMFLLPDKSSGRQARADGLDGDYRRPVYSGLCLVVGTAFYGARYLPGNLLMGSLNLIWYAQPVGAPRALMQNHFGR